ncbi:cag pathogenicity island protein [Halarcobacter mediterraneus]|uniref:Cag pathogenicity island protein n=1 Tax=Halarcobacter mediterraneus TaxID=2023153 RepID=A0A4Q1AZM3_9BACT|nr:cag pathogenicity island Cag12 family protein [Halarcobacter mediterraneus]RXK13239.1 cag pathogenicity island protein [Halarcobacter mediterraneus]
MNKIKLLGSLAITGLLLSGCSQKAPDPKPVENWDKGSSLTINKSLLLKQTASVPKDPFLSTNNWTYQVNATKKDKELFSNEQIVKTFLVAHNAKEIIIVGRNDLITDYRDYFTNNQVTASIKLQPVVPKEENFNTVNILFFNKVEK